MKNELSGKITIKFIELRANTYNQLLDYDSENEKGKKHKKFFHKKNT